MKVTLDVCDQCGAVIGDTEVHKLVHSFSPKFVKKDFTVKQSTKPIGKPINIKDINIVEQGTGEDDGQTSDL